MTLAVTQHVVVTTTGSGSGDRVIPGAAASALRGPLCALDIRVPQLPLHVSVPERPADATDTNGVSGGAGRSVDSATWVQHAPLPSESAPMRTQSSPDFSSTPGRDLALPVSRSGGCRS